ncbi:MAG: TerB family tellurite resistance protein [Candidatus Krumholzibacteria bacterium]|nr:TerB family tellurite resistance protein [Candidatus Krumholzibacteria bacterium]
MFEFFKKTFGGSQNVTDGAAPVSDSEEDLKIATCALFLEIANIDDEFSDEERVSILSLIKSEYGLTEEQAVQLARRAMEELEGSIDLWKFTNLINEHYTDAEKLRVVELIWRVVYADGKLDEHEDYLVHKLGSLLRLKHKQLIAAKLKVLHGG